MKKYIFLIAIALIIQSCISTKSILKDSKHQPIRFSQKQLDGQYKNQHRLWNNLTALNKSEQVIANNKSEKNIVQLKLLSDSQLLVQLSSGSELVDQFILEGKIKKDHFSIKRNLTLIPFFPVFYMQHEYKVLLANNAEGNLILMEGISRGGWMLVYGGGFSKNKSHIISKL